MPLSLLQSTLVGMIVVSSLSYLAVCRRETLARLILKPLSTLLILFLAASFVGQYSSYQQWLALFIVSGLSLSLAGDIFLQLTEKWFRFGLVWFRLAFAEPFGGSFMSPS